MMDTQEWTTVDKAAWGRGPWTNEPDKRQWQDEATGLPCLIVRNPRGGNWCGYVGISRAHPLYGVGYSEETPILSEGLARRMERPMGEHPSFAMMISALSGTVKASADIVIDVHGGLTFADKCDPHPEGPARGICHVPAPGEPDDVWWFGFDCAHSGDLSPGYDLKYRVSGDEDAYRDVNYVTGECRRLAAQLHALVP